MPVFFITPDQIQDRTIKVSGDLFTHIKGSLRIRIGETIRVCDQTRHRYVVRIDWIGRNELGGAILDEQTAPPPSQVIVSLGLAILKGDHMDWVIQKACEIGVSSITPLVTKRVVVKLQDGWKDSKHMRWQRIALEAAQQSEQWTVPKVLIPSDAKRFFLKNTDNTLNLILSERWPGQGLGSIRLPTTTDSLVRIAIGPEGGWEKEELECAMDRGFSPINMGPKILRSETAALAALSIIQSRLGQLG